MYALSLINPLDGVRWATEINLRWITFFFFFTIVKYKFSLIPISCISRNPYIANNQVNFYATSSRLVALESGIIKFKVIERVYVCFTLHLFKL